MSSSHTSSTTELGLGRIRELSKCGRHREALVAAEVLAATMPRNRDVLYLIAANQRCLDRIGEALATLQRLEEHFPRFSLLYQERGHCYTTLRDAPRAIEAFRYAVTLNPALSTSWIMLERLYRMTGDVGNAVTAAERVSSLQQLPSEIVMAGISLVAARREGIESRLALARERRLDFELRVLAEFADIYNSPSVPGSRGNEDDIMLRLSVLPVDDLPSLASPVRR